MDVPPPAGFVTVTFTVPAVAMSAAGIVATICVLVMEMRPDQQSIVEELLRQALPTAHIRVGRQPGLTDHVLIAQLNR